MSVFIRETGGDDLTPQIKQGTNVYLRTGRSNTVRVDGKHFLTDVRDVIPHIKENGNVDVEFHLQTNEDENKITVVLHDVETVVVEFVGHSQKFQNTYYDGIYDKSITKL